MLADLIIFALVLVVLQTIAGLAIMLFFTSDWYIKKLMDKTMEATLEITKKMEEMDL